MSLIIDVKCDCLSNTESLPVMFYSMLIPGNVAGVAKQLLRCMFHQLAPNGILPQLFQSNIKGLLMPPSNKYFCTAPFIMFWHCQ